MIKWCSLQLNLMPVIAMETDAAISKLQQLVEKVSTYGHPTDIEQLNAVRKSILSRIQSLDRFYEQKYHDDTIDIFHMLKLKLQRAVFKLGHINNDTISGDMIADMLTSESRNIQTHKIKESKQSKSPHRPHNQTFNHSNQNSLEQEKLHYQQNLWMKTGNTSFDFSYQHHDELLFKKQVKRQSPSTPSLKKYKIKSKQKTEKFIGKGNKIQNNVSIHNQKLQRTQTQTLQTKIKQNNVEDSSKKIVSSQKKPQANQQKNLTKVLNTSYKEIKQLQKQVPYRSKANLKASTAYHKTERLKITGNQRTNAPHQYQKSSKGNKQLIKQQAEENQGSTINQNQFRFTIKMTKEEYLSLQALRKQLIKTGQLPS